MPALDSQSQPNQAKKISLVMQEAPQPQLAHISIPTEDLDISQLSLDSPGRTEKSTDILQAILKESVGSVNTGLTQTKQTIEENRKNMQTSMNLFSERLSKLEGKDTKKGAKRGRKKKRKKGPKK